MTDTSDIAVGIVLQQKVNDQWCPIAFFSKRLTPPETRYSTFDRELLAVYLAVKHFQHFVSCSRHVLAIGKIVIVRIHFLALCCICSKDSVYVF